ncbi:aminotransferase class V-fold PLP-dependent enzyme [Sinanaerobacter sp. ZZT-01]|uniref:aminotransferase class V-fold PLP-dependent enzyme n=1 Tax=Sinanaerobacter sp. ZZT-01 TaxID=3111540 RepID=UPI002D7A39D4|nr:aminotransferase class V-fold PLP-dependent enzyme [Sinanaerobacter sp. ZZT-01]WRR93320.1 aminotransferase class V-fold PLP-dependent enzyme [Sinanaerobacter sp. ZZT-01]
MRKINKKNSTAATLRELVMDVSYLIPTNNGTLTSIYFDNAGTTPPFRTVVEELEKYTPWYKYISDKSRKAKFLSELYEESRISVKNFFNADMEEDTVIYTKNTTEAINILSNVICQQNAETKPIVITTYMEHLSNYLPWKFRCDTVLVDVEKNGRLSMSDLEEKLDRYKGRVKLVAVAGASNVTGYINPIYEIARMAHLHNAEILVDAAQLMQHRRIDMHPEDVMESIDYIAFSAHKTYAPFFTGALVGNKHALNMGYPLCFGAGITELVTDQEVILKKSPQRYEAGSNNILGVIALATAIQTMIRVHMDVIKKHESELLSYAMRQMKENPRVILYEDSENLEDQVPIIAFNVEGKKPEETARYLYENYGIITKNGYCGADLYVKKLVEGSPYTGIVRISLGLYNQDFEIDRLIKALKSFQ